MATERTLAKHSTAAARMLVFRMARQVWGVEAARIWMESANAYLQGARPVDVVALEGPGRVKRILEAEMWGGGA